MTTPPPRPRSLIRNAVASMTPYSPPEDPDRLARRLGIPVSKVIKLDANENPYGASPMVNQSLAEFSGYHIYPDPDQEHARNVLSEYVGVGPEQLFLGNGSDELIDLLMRAVLNPGDEVVDFSPTFGVYAFVAQQYEAPLIDVPRDERFDIDLGAALRAITPKTKITFLASPNNPTGNPVSRELVERLLDTGVLVVVDEAYAEFRGESLASMVAERDNLVLLRTFSKWAGLAGLRLGYAILPSSLSPHMWKLKAPFNINQAAVIAMEASLNDRAWLEANVRAIVSEQRRLMELLSSIDYLTPYPSAANFILVRAEGILGSELTRYLADQGILVRFYNSERLRKFIRISVGTPPQTDRLIEMLRKAPVQ
ncbi:MAG: histidinol-phosphate transaminase [Chloroflexota bacterium]